MTEPESISVPFPHPKTATIPLDVLQAFIELQRAVELEMTPIYSESPFNGNVTPVWRAYLKLRGLTGVVK